MRIGPFYFDSKELFLVIAIVLLTLAMYFGWPLWRFQPSTLLALSVIFLILKGLLPATHNDVFFFHAVVTIFLTLFLSTFQVLIFYFVTFLLIKLLKLV